NFDGISYAKGASVLRQLMATVGEDVFFTGVRAYLDRHAFANTTFADLLVALEAASGRDLSQWAQAWLQTSGVSTLRLADGQLRSDGHRSHRVGVGLYDRTRRGLVLRERLELDLVDSAPVELTADLVLPNDGDLTFAKVRLDERSLVTVLWDLRRLADPLARAVCWAALWDACRDGELPAADFVGAVLTNIGGERDPAVVATLLAQARTAAVLYDAGDALRDALAEASAAAVWSGNSGDLQLVHVRAFAAVADGFSQWAMLRGLLDGQDVPKGLVVDTELRWSLVQALATLGRLDEAAIDAELARDDTAKGRLHALTARASRPDATAKEQAWTAATGDAALSNHESDAVAAGFWQFDQDELLRDYVHRYAAELPAVWRTRTPQVAGRLTVRLFPSTVVEPAVLDATSGLLDEAHPAGLRRYVAEQRDDLARALRARGAPALPLPGDPRAR
ncbi:MAG: ERAP1-like C-terminal domain-containing protein, partial [Actinobacteria bacterium]|nr:ERAP1-like C-terminal domain-containing protein [Actinomycetota bacterium]